MKKSISPILRTGLLIFIILTTIERFIMPISNYIAIPILLVAIILIIAGSVKNERWR